MDAVIQINDRINGVLYYVGFRQESYKATKDKSKAQRFSSIQLAEQYIKSMRLERIYHCVFANQ